MAELPLVDSGLAVLVFSTGDDLIAYLNKAMAFLTPVASLRFPSANNQFRTSLNQRNYATIQNGRVTVQQVQGRQGQSYSGTGYKSYATSSGGNNASGHARLEAATIEKPGFAATLAVLITGASQSRQHGKSESDSYYLSD
nr:hypothetical protein [Tanacetum cinerariifolium]